MVEKLEIPIFFVSYESCIRRHKQDLLWNVFCGKVFIYIKKTAACFPLLLSCQVE